MTVLSRGGCSREIFFQHDFVGLAHGTRRTHSNSTGRKCVRERGVHSIGPANGLSAVICQSHDYLRTADGGVWWSAESILLHVALLSMLFENNFSPRLALLIFFSKKNRKYVLYFEKALSKKVYLCCCTRSGRAGSKQWIIRALGASYPHPFAYRVGTIFALQCYTHNVDALHLCFGRNNWRDDDLLFVARTSGRMPGSTDRPPLLCHTRHFPEDS